MGQIAQRGSYGGEIAMKEDGMKDTCMASSGITWVVQEWRSMSLPFTMSFTRVWSAKTSRMYSAGARCSIAGPSLPRRPNFSVWKYIAPLLANGFSGKGAFRRSNRLGMTHIHRVQASWCQSLAPPTLPKRTVSEIRQAG
jgi:hypothetical protein